MYEFSPMTDRVERMRKRYRDTVPRLDLTRYRIITDFYMNNRSMSGTMKRALNFRNMCEKMPIFVREDELIVGSYTATYKASALYPEYSVSWLVPELSDDSLSTRECDPYLYSPEDKAYIFETLAFWDEECLNAKVNPYIPPEYAPLASNCALTFTAQDICPQPVGHFAPNYWKPLHVGFAAVKQEADEKAAKLLAEGLQGEDARAYEFYRGVSIVCEGIITYAKRYSAELAKMVQECDDPARKAELERMADTMGWIMENPGRDFRDAIQALWFYQMCILMDGNMHGTSVGRLDQILGEYVERDLESGAITWEEAQELVDLYYLKVAECNKAWAGRVALSSPGYTSGQLITLGGVDAEGNDATNPITYMGLESMGRMKMHSPTQGLRVHRGTPRKLWECAIAVNKVNGGVPAWFSDEQIIPTLLKRGTEEADARNYCLIGCVEPAVGGASWPASGGMGTNSYINNAHMLMLAINGGKAYRTTGPLVDTETQFGPNMGTLADMESIEEVKDAYTAQMRYWVDWYTAMNNAYELVAREFMPQPLVSSMMTGCMESGRDVTYGGAKYNSTGISGIGLGNVIESLNLIDEAVFHRHMCSGQELLDALHANWEGYEDLRQRLLTEIVHYGNGDAYADRYTKFVAEGFADYVATKTGPRGNNYAAGMFPVTLNITYGKFTGATPDGRRSGEPLSDGISAVQGLDVSGPTAILNSVTRFDHQKYTNGVLLNMKFSPSAVAGDEGTSKLIDLMSTYFFDLGGAEMQLNIVSADTLRDAQAHPENYKDLVVRIAGFSAYFVEVYKAAQDDLIKRTELSL